MSARQPHTHLTCGFCLQPNIVRSKPHETKGDRPICPGCLADWRRCFPDHLTTVNNLSTLEPVASLIHLERYTK